MALRESFCMHHRKQYGRVIGFYCHNSLRRTEAQQSEMTTFDVVSGDTITFQKTLEAQINQRTLNLKYMRLKCLYEHNTNIIQLWWVEIVSLYHLGVQPCGLDWCGGGKGDSHRNSKPNPPRPPPPGTRGVFRAHFHLNILMV